MVRLDSSVYRGVYKYPEFNITQKTTSYKCDDNGHFGVLRSMRFSALNLIRYTKLKVIKNFHTKYDGPKYAKPLLYHNELSAQHLIPLFNSQ